MDPGLYFATKRRFDSLAEYLREHPLEDLDEHGCSLDRFWVMNPQDPESTCTFVMTGEGNSSEEAIGYCRIWDEETARFLKWPAAFPTSEMVLAARRDIQEELMRRAKVRHEARRNRSKTESEETQEE